MDESLYARETMAIAELEEIRDTLALLGFASDTEIGTDPADAEARVMLYTTRPQLLELVRRANALTTLGAERLERIEQDLRVRGEHGDADALALAGERLR